jgi:hypothetical protein
MILIVKSLRAATSFLPSNSAIENPTPHQPHLIPLCSLALKSRRAHLRTHFSSALNLPSLSASPPFPRAVSSHPLSLTRALFSTSVPRFEATRHAPLTVMTQSSHLQPRLPGTLPLTHPCRWILCPSLSSAPLLPECCDLYFIFAICLNVLWFVRTYERNRGRDWTKEKRQKERKLMTITRGGGEADLNHLLTYFLVGSANSPPTSIPRQRPPISARAQLISVFD